MRTPIIWLITELDLLPFTAMSGMGGLLDPLSSHVNPGIPVSLLTVTSGALALWQSDVGGEMCRGFVFAVHRMENMVHNRDITQDKHANICDPSN